MCRSCSRAGARRAESYEARSVVSIKANPLTRPTLERVRARVGTPARAVLDTTIREAGRTPAWVVGGAVRDVAAGRRARDLDVATAGDAGALAEAVARALAGAAAAVEPRFGTASVVLGGVQVDLATLRTERYARPGALPTVRLGASIEDDLARRDFSVNAVALALSGPHAGELCDPFEGLADLRARRLRVLHARSFVDDATRLWRGVRVAARLGLTPDEETARLIEDGARWLAPISAARLWAEFERTAAEPRVGQTCALLERWGVFAGTHPAFRLTTEARSALARRRGPVPPAVLLAVLLAPLEHGPAGTARPPHSSRSAAPPLPLAPPPEAAKLSRGPGVRADRDAIAARLGAPRAAARAASEAAALLALTGGGPEHLARVEGASPEARLAARWLDPDRQPALQRQLARWERTRAPLRAPALEALGVPRGPALQATLERLRRARYLGTLDGAAEARRLVRQWLESDRA